MMNDFTEQDFKACAFNPMKAELYDSYPKLEAIMGGLVADERVIRYIIMMYDPGSPLIQAEPALDKRKNRALILADLMMHNTLPEELKELTNDIHVQAIIVYLFNFTNSRLWQRVVVNEQLYEEYCKRLMQPVRSSNNVSISGDDGATIKKGMIVQEKDELTAYTIKGKLREELDAIGAALDGYYKQLFANDDQLVKKNKLRYTPEMMAGLG
jgi:hypothetical protein